MLKAWMIEGRVEAGCDEAGRGPLAGPVMAAAVVLPRDYRSEELNDSKKLSERMRERLRWEIEEVAVAWAVARVEPEEIDQINILHAATHAMCMAAKAIGGETVEGTVGRGSCQVEHLLVDGNRFYNETELGYTCVVKGDAQYMAIAAASILAKTHRDEAMVRLAEKYPEYGWERNKGYPTADHYEAIERYGLTPQHRRSFRLQRQLTMEF